MALISCCIDADVVKQEQQIPLLGILFQTRISQHSSSEKLTQMEPFILTNRLYPGALPRKQLRSRRCHELLASPKRTS